MKTKMKKTKQELKANFYKKIRHHALEYAKWTSLMTTNLLHISDAIDMDDVKEIEDCLKHLYDLYEEIKSSHQEVYIPLRLLKALKDKHEKSKS